MLPSWRKDDMTWRLKASRSRKEGKIEFIDYAHRPIDNGYKLLFYVHCTQNTTVQPITMRKLFHRRHCLVSRPGTVVSVMFQRQRQHDQKRKAQTECRMSIHLLGHTGCAKVFFLHLLLAFVFASSFSISLVRWSRSTVGSTLPNVNWGESEIEKW